MKVERLTLRNFRNVKESTLLPAPTLNFLLGANGQGKTSFIEALGFLSTLRSFREAKAASVVRWGAESSDISCTVTSEDVDFQDWRTDLKVSFQISDSSRKKATKTAFINDKAYKSSTLYLTQRFGSYELGFHAIVFNPSDHDLVRGDPGIRRSYLDRVISAEDDEYLKTLQKFNRTLEQRNALLKTQNKQSSALYLSFTEQLCHSSVKLTLQRLNWVQRLNQLLSSKLLQIAPRQSMLRSAYVSTWVPRLDDLSFNNRELDLPHFTGQGQMPSLELLEQAFWEKVSAFETAEWRAGHTLVGPHRDDLAFFLGDQALKSFGSQGEVRSALLALKLTEIELFRNKTGHRPIFLLDDFSSELDVERRSFLVQFLMKTDLQTFVTTTEDSGFVGKRYWVCNGVIEEGRHDNRTETIRFE